MRRRTSDISEGEVPTSSSVKAVVFNVVVSFVDVSVVDRPDVVDVDIVGIFFASATDCVRGTFDENYDVTLLSLLSSYRL